jgi:hypothetical protein
MAEKNNNKRFEGIGDERRRQVWIESLSLGRFEVYGESNFGRSSCAVIGLEARVGRR